MNVKNLLNKIDPSCPKCPYTLGLVRTVRNPCPQCKLNGYQSFEQFIVQRNKQVADKKA